MCVSVVNKRKKPPIETVILICSNKSNRLIQTRACLINHIVPHVEAIHSHSHPTFPPDFSARPPTGRHTKKIYIYSVCVWCDTKEDVEMGSDVVVLLGSLF